MSEECRLLSVHNRLSDAHTLWHEALGAYHVPDRFRTFLNSTIQTLRSVTFVLQKSKRDIEGFDEWYQPWQDKMRDDRIMRWLVDARNTVVKKGDLKTASVARLSLIAAYTELPTQEFEVDPMLDLEGMASWLSQRSLPESLRANGTVVVERMWRVGELEQQELLEGLGHVFGRLVELLHDAHLQTGLSPEAAISCISGGFDRDHEIRPRVGWKPQCMIAVHTQRAFSVRLDSGERAKIVLRSGEPTEKEMNEAADRYGPWPDPADDRSTTPEGVAEFFFEGAQRMFLEDGYHLPFAFLLDPEGKMSIVALRMDEIAEKYLVARELARQVERLRAESVIFIGEVWVAPHVLGTPLRNPEESPGKFEVLSATLATRDGRYSSWWCPIIREEGKVALGPRQYGPVAPIYIQPVLDLWKTWEAEETSS